MTTATMTIVEMPSEDAIIGLDRAMSYFQRAIEDAAEVARSRGLTPAIDDVATCLQAAQAWLMSVNHQVHLNAIANERQNLIEKRRAMQHEMMSLNSRITSLRESILATPAGKIDPDVALDSPELMDLLAARRILMDAMPKATDLGLATIH